MNEPAGRLPDEEAQVLQDRREVGQAGADARVAIRPIGGVRRSGA